MKKIIPGFALIIVMALLLAASALAEGSVLYIDTETVYPGMAKSYAQGYVPSVVNGNAEFVLPLKSNDPAVTGVTVTPVISTDEASPFSYGNYEFNASADVNGVFLITLSLPLKANRVNGTYPVVFSVRFTDGAGKQQTQEFPVYLTVADGADPNAPEATPKPAGMLYIDSNNLYAGMAKTYAKGYMPDVSGNKAIIVLPLTGETYDGVVTLTASLGATDNSPFVYGNYSQTVASRGWTGVYVFTLEIPLAKGRINGSYPVALNASYINASGAVAQQSFTVYVTVTDGKTPPDPNEIVKTPAEKPELYISDCTVEPGTVGGNETFTVKVNIDNIGNIRARSVKLSYSSQVQGILPADTNSSILLENIASGESAQASFAMRTTGDVLAGAQSFSITLDYVDLYGGIYSSTREFLVTVTQPVEMSFDAITVPKAVTAGDTLSLPANVFNIGKATLRNVTVTVSGAGLFPVASVFLGDIPPGEAGYGELKVFIGMISMTEGYTQSYGNTSGTYTITYFDDAGEEYALSTEFTTEIKQPIIETDTKPSEDEQQPVIQWWVAVLVGFAVIAVIVAVIVVTRLTRFYQLGGRG